MEYRTLDISSIAAMGLKSSSFSGKVDSYAVVSISETTGKLLQKIKTYVHKNGGSNPNWIFPMKFTVNEAAVVENRLMLVVKIKAVKMFVDKNLGEVSVPVKELLEGVRNDENGMKIVSYELKGKSGIKNDGAVSFSYKFGENFVKENVVEETVTPHLNARKEKFGKTTSGDGFGSSFFSGLFVSDFGSTTAGGGHAGHGGHGHGSHGGRGGGDHGHGGGCGGGHDHGHGGGDGGGCGGGGHGGGCGGGGCGGS